VEISFGPRHFLTTPLFPASVAFAYRPRRSPGWTPLCRDAATTGGTPGGEEGGREGRRARGRKGIGTKTHRWAWVIASRHSGRGRAEIPT
jgi:hypothetical protein